MEALRKCTKCGLEAHTHKDLALFTNNPSCKYKKANLCKECQTKASIKSYEKNKEKIRKREYINRKLFKVQAIAMKGGQCCKCGVKYDGNNEVIFDFHHIDPSTKDFNISDIRNNSNKAKKELDKCILLCANCHRMEHKDDSIN